MKDLQTAHCLQEVQWPEASPETFGAGEGFEALGFFSFFGFGGAGAL